VATSNAFIIFIVKDSQSVFLKFCRAINISQIVNRYLKPVIKKNILNCKLR